MTAKSSGLAIHVIWDPSVSNAPKGFKAAVTTAVNVLDGLFTNPVALKIEVGWDAKLNGSSSLDFNVQEPFSYAQIRTALIADQQSAVQVAANATLPAQDPTPGAHFVMTGAEAEALGLLSRSNGIEGAVTFGVVDVGFVEHELTEVMGRVATENAAQSLSQGPTPMDLFRYAAPGVRDLTTKPPLPYTAAYFSVDGGTTNLGNWNTAPQAGDVGDWAVPGGPSPNDAFGYVAAPGSTTLTTADVALLEVIGWNTDAAPNTVANGVTDYIGNGSTHSGMTVVSGGVQEAASGGTAVNTIVNSGGQVIVLSGGTATNTTLNGGGVELVHPGAAVSRTTISGGTLELQVGTAAGGSIVFAAGAGGSLRIDGTTMPTGVISGFGPGDAVDLRGVAPHAGGTASLQAGGVLQIVEGASTYQLHLDPAETLAGHTLQLVGDGHGGTFFRDLAGPGGGISVAAGSGDTLRLGLLDTVTGGSHSLIVAGPHDLIEGGSNDTVDLSNLTPGTGGALIADTGSKIADTVIGFAPGVDHLSFAGETLSSETAVIAAAVVKKGNLVLTYPDHSAITLIGVTHADIGIFA